MTHQTQRKSCKDKKLTYLRGMMKGEYDHQHKNEGMFSKLNPFSHHFQLSRGDTSQGEDSTGGQAQSNNPRTNEPGNDGATIEVVRRPRGRPPGSKNKPKPPVIITRDPEPAMSPFVLEVSGGNDVVDALTQFSRRRNLGLCVLTGSGAVANVTLRQPSTTPGATITFHGRFDILSINATFLPQTTSHPPPPNIFTISLAGPQGQIVGGAVAGGLVAAAPVLLIATSFNNPSYHRLPPEEEAGNSVSGGGGGGGDGHSPPVSGGGGESETPGDQSCGMSVYSCNLGSDVIWAPTARPPPPY